MDAIRLKVRVEKDGEIVLRDLPIHRNDRLDVILLKEKEVMQPKTTEAGDPVLKLQGLGKDIWKGIDPDVYVKNLREGWE